MASSELKLSAAHACAQALSFSSLSIDDTVEGLDFSSIRALKDIEALYRKYYDAEEFIKFIENHQYNHGIKKILEEAEEARVLSLGMLNFDGVKDNIYYFIKDKLNSGNTNFPGLTLEIVSSICSLNLTNVKHDDFIKLTNYLTTPHIYYEKLLAILKPKNDENNALPAEQKENSEQIKVKTISNNQDIEENQEIQLNSKNKTTEKVESSSSQNHDNIEKKQLEHHGLPETNHFVPHFFFAALTNERKYKIYTSRFDEVIDISKNGIAKVI